MTAVQIVDETVGGARADALTLDFLTERVTVRELIRARVYQEVAEHNATRRAAPFRGLVQPTETERELNGDRPPRFARVVDWEAQAAKAIEGFTRNRFLLFVDDRQVTELEEEIELRHDTAVTFLRLMPLVGG
jgi:hypothetical protein